jgi:uncharacterized surface protein with fasciclin (FAS1) repeats
MTCWYQAIQRGDIPIKNVGNRFLSAFTLALACFLVAPSAVADRDGYGYKKTPTILEKLVQTDGAQAVVAAVLVVDEAQVLPFSLAEILGDRKAEVVLLAPSNAAFEKLLGLAPGYLNGMSIGEVQPELPGALPDGVGAPEVAEILLKHVALPKRANLWRASEDALLKKGSIVVAAESEFPVGIGATGVQINYETTVIKANIGARNGVIHYIDTVIVDGLL